MASKNLAPQGRDEGHAAILRQATHSNENLDTNMVDIRTGMRYIQDGEPGGGRIEMASIRHHHMWRGHE